MPPRRAQLRQSLGKASSTDRVASALLQVQFALKHFRDVVSNNKLEVLPGNGTVVLETVATIHSALKMCLLNEQSAQSSLLVSATNQVYQSMAQLIKLCDDVLLNKPLNTENVHQVG